MSRLRKRADRIRAEIPIQQVLTDYGYRVDGGYSGEQQFSCDLHGDGIDNKPSARVYPDSGSWYCFSCDRSRDAITTAREKEGLDLWAAMKALETRYHLPPLPWDDDDKEAAQQRRDAKANGAMAQVEAALDRTRTFEDDRKSIGRLLDSLTAERDLPMRTVLGFWEAYDKICQMVDADLVEHEPARLGLARIKDLAQTKMLENAK